MKASLSASSPKRVSSVPTGASARPDDQLRELVADLAADRPEAAAQDVADRGLEDEAVGGEAVQGELLLDDAAELLRGAGDEEDEVLEAARA
jgi:hypothetical protein